MNRLSATRLRRAPIPPILSSASAVMTSAPIRRGSPLHLLRSGQDRLHDVLVTRTAALVAGQRPANLVLGRVGGLLQQRLGREHHARGAEPALQAEFVLECL